MRPKKLAFAFLILFVTTTTNLFAQVRCSTEKVNGDCYIDIDRHFPLTLPPIQLKRTAKVWVFVNNPLGYETLTLESGSPAAYEPSDQAAGFFNNALPVLKGNSYTSPITPTNFMAMNTLALVTDRINYETLLGLNVAPNPAQADFNSLDQMLRNSTDVIFKYLRETATIYNQVRKLSLPLPRPRTPRDNIELALGNPDLRFPDPITDYQGWRNEMLKYIKQQAVDTTSAWNLLPLACYDPTKASKPIEGPWLPPARQCTPSIPPPPPIPAPPTIPAPPPVLTFTQTIQPSPAPLMIPANYDSTRTQLDSDLAAMCNATPEADECKKVKRSVVLLDERHQRIADFFQVANALLAVNIAKYTTDMQTIYSAIFTASGPPKTLAWNQLSADNQDADNRILLGIILGPSATRANGETVVLQSRILAPTDTYSVNVQNRIINSLFAVPATTQRVSIASITVLYADPKFDISTGSFFSWLPNRSFTNTTNVTITSGTPSTSSIQITGTKTTPPLVIPYVGAHYRLSRESLWLDGRRKAFYGTFALGLNPYNQQVEYGFGFSLSWRYIMISPLYHLGRPTHLTQGEQVGQTWCAYGGGATATSNPPLCAGSPPAPTTKNYWTGAFAIGIGVRVPTLFSSTNR